MHAIRRFETTRHVILLAACTSAFIVAVAPNAAGGSGSEKAAAVQAAPSSNADAAGKDGVLRMDSEERMYLFRDKRNSDSPILTSRPEKYRNDPNFMEVPIKYTPAPRAKKDPNAADLSSARTFASIVSEQAAKNNVDENLVYAVIQASSGFDPYMVSVDGRRGLMQLESKGDLEAPERDVFDPRRNIADGALYLSKLVDVFKGDQGLAVAAFKAGPEAVKKAGAVPAQTRDYVRKVMALREQFSKEKITSFTAKQPDAKARYTVHFKNGMTQAADRVVEDKTVYWVTSEGQRRAVTKEKVQEITDAEAATPQRN